jgi:hypothetical protein
MRQRQSHVRPLNVYDFVADFFVAAQLLGDDRLHRVRQPESTLDLRIALAKRWQHRLDHGVLWLCSDAAHVVIGHAIVIDGGQTIQ